MLAALHLKQFVTFEELHLAFGRGLHVLTGESGAGKSVILDGLQLLLGQRGSADFIRHGADKSQLEALFTYSAAHPVREILQAAGVEEEPEADGQTYSLVIQRELTRQGRSVCRVNGHLVPLSLLRQLGKRLVNTYRQHESQQFFAPHEQRQWLDGLLPDEEKQRLDAYRRLWKTYRRRQEEYEQLLAQEKQALRQQDLYRFQLEEIRSAALSDHEEEQLLEEQKKLAHAEKIVHAFNSAYHLLAADGGATDQLAAALDHVQQIVPYDGEAAPLVELLQQAFFVAEEAMIELRRRKETVYSDPERLSEIEERIALIKQLKRKYGDSIADILAYAQHIEQELHWLEHREERLEELKRRLEEDEAQLLRLAAAVSEARRRVAQALTPRIQQALNELQLENFQFVIQVTPRAADGADPVRRLDGDGMDDVQFLVAPNGAPELLPLVKVASGGELSRLMLALKTVVTSPDVAMIDEDRAVSDDAVTIVFDEIDTGVSGQSAQAVAEKLCQLSRQQQVLCISHQPQVVCMADVHFLVEKETGPAAVASRVHELNWNERVHALARMMEGDHVSDLTLAQAENMLRRAQQWKREMEKQG